MNGGPNGDIYVVLAVSQHPKFKRKGQTIYSEEQVDYLDALLGAELDVATIHGSQKMKVPALTKNGFVTKLDGVGVRLDKNGDHYVTLTLKTPAAITEEERQLLEQIRKARK
jgi:DnaJ-class molecular chaperone